MSRLKEAKSLLKALDAALEAVNAFVGLNAQAIREVTGITLPEPQTSTSIYTTSNSHALVLQIYTDALARNLGESDPVKLPA